MYLTELWGDVPFLDKVVKTPEEGMIPREEKKVVVDHILADLEKAAEALPYKWEGEPERITKGAVLGLHARISLYNGYYEKAAASAKRLWITSKHLAINFIQTMGNCSSWQDNHLKKSCLSCLSNMSITRLNFL